MSTVNLVILVGRLGKDPEQRFMPSGGAVVSFSIATEESWKDKQTGERKERTEWSEITAFGKLAEICAQYLKKGSRVYIQGKLRTDKYEKDGQTHYRTKVVADQMRMLDSKPQGQTNAGAVQSTAAEPAGEFEDDPEIPF